MGWFSILKIFFLSAEAPEEDEDEEDLPDASDESDDDIDVKFRSAKDETPSRAPKPIKAEDDQVPLSASSSP